MNRFQKTSNPVGRALIASALFGFLFAAFAIVLPVQPAQAATPTPGGQAPISFQPVKPHDERDHGEEEDGDDDGDEHDGEDLHDHPERDGSLQIPPLVIKPKHDDRDGDDDSQGFVAPGVDPANPGASGLGGRYEVGPVAGGPGYPLGAAAGTLPEDFVEFAPDGGAPVGQNPIDIRNVNFDQPTPADVFMQSATVALGAMGIGALALVGVTASRGKLVRRPKTARPRNYDYTSAD